MNKFLFAFTIVIPICMFAAPVPDNLGGACLCDSDTDIGCVGDCDGCEPVNDPATNYVDCVLASTEDDLDDTEDLIDDDFDETDEESDETGLFGVVEGTYADYEEIYIIDPDTPYTNEIEITPSWCD